MHECDEFRERITDQIFDPSGLNAAIRRELLECSGCTEFYTEAREMIDVLSSVRFEIPESRWDSMTDRLRVRIERERERNHRSSWKAWLWYGPVMAAAAAMLLVTLALYHIAVSPVDLKPVAVRTESAAPADPALDPVTVEYLEQSELLLRSVMKLQPASAEDVQDARRIADRQLIALDQRKHAVADLKPAVTVMNKYETILRDIRNLKQRTAPEDIVDIKNRIEKNGLIENMKSLQPKPVVDTGLAIER